MFSTANRIWNVIKWVWIGLILVVCLGIASNLAVLQTTDFSKTILVAIWAWLMELHLLQILLFGISGLFLAVTLAAGLLVMIGEYLQSGQVVRSYLRSIIDENTGLSPVGIYQQSQALISVNVRLDDNFIPLKVAANRPQHDMPDEQLRQLEAMRQLSTLSIEEREEQVQKLRGIWWYAHHERLISEQSLNVGVDTMLQRLTAANPVAVLLGAPGSGKSTTLRWLALHMARASRSARYLLPGQLRIQQIPLLLHISEYVGHLSQPGEMVSFESFFLKHMSNGYVVLETKIKEDLERGRCLVLLDGLDEVASDDARRRVARDIQRFIAHYSTNNIHPRRANRFVITSRIVGYEEGPFSTATHCWN